VRTVVAGHRYRRRVGRQAAANVPCGGSVHVAASAPRPAGMRRRPGPGCMPRSSRCV